MLQLRYLLIPLLRQAIIIVWLPVLLLVRQQVQVQYLLTTMVSAIAHHITIMVSTLTMRLLTSALLVSGVQLSMMMVQQQQLHMKTEQLIA